MGVGVGDAVKDCVMIEQELEAAEVYAHGEDEQQEPKGEGESAPGQRESAGEPPADGARAAGDEG